MRREDDFAQLALKAGKGELVIAVAALPQITPLETREIGFRLMPFENGLDCAQAAIPQSPHGEIRVRAIKTGFRQLPMLVRQLARAVDAQRRDRRTNGYHQHQYSAAISRFPERSLARRRYAPGKWR